MKDIAIFYQLCVMNIKQLLAYRASFWITFVLMAGWAFAYIIFVEVLFGHINSLAGWSKGGTLLVLAYYYLFQNISDIFYKDNFEEFGELMRRGELDFRLTKPASSRLLTFLYHMRFDQCASLIVTAGLFMYAFSELETPVSIILFIAGMLYTVLSVLLYFSVLSILSTFAFWVQKSDTFRVLIWNVSQVARYPRHIYTGILGKILTFVIPLTGLASIPAEIALKMHTNGLPLLYAGLTVFFYLLSLLFWQYGLKKYSSAG